jgi:hypothetical protein
MSAPGYFVIGDSLPFRAEEAVSARTGDPLLAATATYSMLDAQSRAEVAAGDMVLYDQILMSFEAEILPEDLELYDATTNPNGVVPNREYLLKATVDDGGIKTSRALRLVALLDPPANR